MIYGEMEAYWVSMWVVFGLCVTICICVPFCVFFICLTRTQYVIRPSPPKNLVAEEDPETTEYPTETFSGNSIPDITEATECPAETFSGNNIPDIIETQKECVNQTIEIGTKENASLEVSESVREVMISDDQNMSINIETQTEYVNQTIEIGTEENASLDVSESIREVMITDDQDLSINIEIHRSIEINDRSCDSSSMREIREEAPVRNERKRGFD